MLSWIKSLFCKQIYPPGELEVLRCLIQNLRTRGVCNSLTLPPGTYDRIIEEMDQKGRLVVSTPDGGILVDGVRIYRERH